MHSQMCCDVGCVRNVTKISLALRCATFAEVRARRLAKNVREVENILGLVIIVRVQVTSTSGHVISVVARAVWSLDTAMHVMAKHLNWIVMLVSVHLHMVKLAQFASCANRRIWRKGGT